MYFNKKLRTKNQLYIFEIVHYYCVNLNHGASGKICFVLNKTCYTNTSFISKIILLTTSILGCKLMFVKRDTTNY